MKVHTAIVLSENEVLDHNCPTILVAATAEELLAKVRDHVAKFWGMTSTTPEQVMQMSIDEINEALEVDPDSTDYGDVMVHVEEHEI